MPCVPYAGASVGFYSLPEPGTGIWVEFEAGDPSFPIWSGCFWGDNELPDSGGAAIKIWKTEKLTLRMDDDSDEMKLETTSGSEGDAGVRRQDRKRWSRTHSWLVRCRQRIGGRKSGSDFGIGEGKQRRVGGDVIVSGNTLNVASTLMCPHGGSVQIISSMFA